MKGLKFIKVKYVREFAKENNHQIGSQALEALNVRVRNIILSSCGITPQKGRIKETEIMLAKG